MPRRKAGCGKRKTRKKNGGSKFTDFFTKSIPSAFRKVRDTHILSNVLNLIPHPGAKIAGTIAGKLGMGRGKRGGANGHMQQQTGLGRLNGRLYLV